jgi:PII-like signaling protein
MVSPEAEHVLLRIHLSNFVRWHGQPLYEALVEKARKEKLAGATVLAGIAGYFGNGPVLGDHPFALQVERPVVVEIVDRPETIDQFLDATAKMVVSQPMIITLERVRIVSDRGEARPR